MRSFLISLALTSVAHAQALTLSAPPGTKAEEVKASADALKARCIAYGYKGVEVKLDGIKVSVTSDPPLTDAMVSIVKAMGERPFKSVEWRAAYAWKPQEIEQYPPPAAEKAARSPKGSRWLFYRGLDGKVWDSEIALAREELAVSHASLKPCTDGTGLAFDVPAKLKVSETTGLYLIVDGYVVGRDWKLGYRFGPSGDTADRVPCLQGSLLMAEGWSPELLRAMFAHPLSVELR